MREVGILEAKTNLSALIEAVDREGEDILITRHGRPAARLTSVAPADGSQRRKLSGPELAEKFARLRARIAREHPETDKLTWEELKADMRR